MNHRLAIFTDTQLNQTLVTQHPTEFYTVANARSRRQAEARHSFIKATREANATVLSNNPDCKNVLVVCSEPPPP